MATLILDPSFEEQVRAARERSGSDRFDEVWDGTLVMAPLPNNEHQFLQGDIVAALGEATRDIGGKAAPGANISDRDEDWEHNYRCPDVVVFLPRSTARDRGTHFQGGPDFGVEIVSKGDTSRKKFEFYASVNTREILIVDRFPWSLELFRLKGATMVSVGRSVDPSTPVESAVIPVRFHLAPGPTRPQVVITHRETGQTWTA
jgi:Uma2 family endonuclease